MPAGETSGAVMHQRGASLPVYFPDYQRCFS